MRKAGVLDLVRVVRLIALSFFLVGIAMIVAALPLAVHGGMFGGAHFGAIGMVIALPAAAIALALSLARWLISRMKFESEP